MEKIVIPSVLKDCVIKSLTQEKFNFTLNTYSQSLSTIQKLTLELQHGRTMILDDETLELPATAANNDKNV